MYCRSPTKHCLCETTGVRVGHSVRWNQPPEQLGQVQRITTASKLPRAHHHSTPPGPYASNTDLSPSPSLTRLPHPPLPSSFRSISHGLHATGFCDSDEKVCKDVGEEIGGFFATLGAVVIVIIMLGVLCCASIIYLACCRKRSVVVVQQS